MKPEVPEWVKDAVFYQIFPDRFAKSDRVKKPANLLEWTDPPHDQKYHGGDLLGVVEKLDYLADMGINAIYMTPIFQSACNHRYHTHDYYQVDPLLGGNDALRELVTESHRRGIKVVLDGVFNHCSRGFFQFNDILENGPHSAWLEWFKIEGWPLAPYTGRRPANYVGWRENRSLPEFDTDHPEVREFIMDVAEYWIREFEIDGWRLDVAGEIETPGFWEEFRQRVRAINPEAYIVSEIWTLSPEWVTGDKFDAHMNYPFTEAIVNFAGQHNISEKISEHPEFQPRKDVDASQFGNQIQKVLDAYHWETTCVSLNLLDSHDTARMISIVQGDKASLRLATFFQMTYPGAPSIYYGDEIGIRGTLDYDKQHQDRHARWPMPWSESDQDLEMLDYFKSTIALRNRYEELRRGTFHQIAAEGLVYVFERKLESSSLLVAMNAGDDDASIVLNASLLASEYCQTIFGAGRIANESSNLKIEIPGRTGAVFSA